MRRHDFHIGLFSDSINIPPKEGINVHSYDLLKQISSLKNSKITLFLCDRGWLSEGVLKAQPFDTVLINEEQFYDHKVISSLINGYGLDITQTYMPYFGSRVLTRASINSGVPTVAEIHDIERFVVPVYFDEQELDEAIDYHEGIQKQWIENSTLSRVMSKFDHDYILKNWEGLNGGLFNMPVGSEPVNEKSRGNNKKSAVFVGNISYPPNEKGAKVIQSIIAPCNRNLEYVIAGRGSERYDGKNIKGLGIVEDLSPLLCEAAIGLSPIVDGSGMKIKNLTYLKHGIPVLTTSLGAQGYPKSEAIIIEDDFSKWDEIISKVIADSNYRSRLSKEAKELFDREFNLNKSVKKLVKMYKKAASNYKSRIYTENYINDPIDMRHVYWLRESREKGAKTVDEPTLIRGAK